jgi:hypothetical protein
MPIQHVTQDGQDFYDHEIIHGNHRNSYELFWKLQHELRQLLSSIQISLETPA